MSTLCSCARAGATELEQLDHLVNDEGMDQVAACRLLWGEPKPLTFAEQLQLAGAEAVAIVRAGLADVLAWLGEAVPA